MEKVIVSMTSFPAAIPFAAKAIQSILAGSVLPDMLVLYLTASQFPNGEIPPELQALIDKNSIFEVRFYEENIRSYTKLIPALKDFPNDIIVTVDDDVLYHKNMLRGLLRAHKRHMNVIIGHRVKRIRPNAPYSKWKRYRSYRFLTAGWWPKFSNLQTGVGGVLYPPNSLKAEMLDSKIFMAIAPTADDVWFWAAATANGTKVAPVFLGCLPAHGLKKPPEICLMHINIKKKSGTDVNRAVFESILEKYPVIRQRI